MVRELQYEGDTYSLSEHFNSHYVTQTEEISKNTFFCEAYSTQAWLFRYNMLTMTKRFFPLIGLTTALIATGTVLTLSASAVHAQKALDITGGQAFANTGFNLGWSFSVTSSSVSVDGLGIWDESSNGLLNNHEVGIWNSSGTLLTSTTVTNANSTASSSALPAGQWLFTDITPISLQVGTYTIGALYSTTGTEDSWRESTSNTTAAGIDYGDRLFDLGNTFARPTLSGSGTSGYIGPNFRIASAVAVPEANTFTLALPALGMIGAVVIKRRKK